MTAVEGWAAPGMTPRHRDDSPFAAGVAEVRELFPETHTPRHAAPVWRRAVAAVYAATVFAPEQVTR